MNSLITDALVYVNGQEDSSSSFSLVRVLEATKQVVSGMFYKLKAEFKHADNNVVCRFEIWERAWIKPDGREVDIKCENNKNYKFNQEAQRDNRVRQKRDRLVGAPEAASTDDQEIVTLVNESLVKVNGDEGGEGYK